MRLIRSRYLALPVSGYLLPGLYFSAILSVLNIVIVFTFPVVYFLTPFYLIFSLVMFWRIHSRKILEQSAPNSTHSDPNSEPSITYSSLRSRTIVASLFLIPAVLFSTGIIVEIIHSNAEFTTFLNWVMAWSIGLVFDLICIILAATTLSALKYSSIPTGRSKSLLYSLRFVIVIATFCIVPFVSPWLVIPTLVVYAFTEIALFMLKGT